MKNKERQKWPQEGGDKGIVMTEGIFLGFWNNGSDKDIGVKTGKIQGKSGVQLLVMLVSYL